MFVVILDVSHEARRPPAERRPAGPPAAPRGQAAAPDPSPGHPPAEGHERLLRAQQGEPPVSRSSLQFSPPWLPSARLYVPTCLCLFSSVPIIATAVQEELETGCASSGDATCAVTTVTQTRLVSPHKPLLVFLVLHTSSELYDGVLSLCRRRSTTRCW